MKWKSKKIGVSYGGFKIISSKLPMGDDKLGHREERGPKRAPTAYAGARGHVTAPIRPDSQSAIRTDIKTDINRISTSTVEHATDTLD